MRSSHKNTNLVRLGAFVLALALNLGCTTIGQYRVVSDAAKVQTDAPTPIVVIVLDGLNQNTLTEYLSQLEANAFSPPWLSGLALLARDQFKLGYTTRGGTAIPSSRHASIAALATGTYPDNNGIVNSFLIRQKPQARFADLSRQAHPRFWNLANPHRTAANVRRTVGVVPTARVKNLARRNRKHTGQRHCISLVAMAQTGRYRVTNAAVRLPSSTMQPQRKQSPCSTKRSVSH